MMSHTQPPEVLAKQARIMVDAGCQCVYVVDSAGALVMEQTADRVAAVVAEIGHEADVGFHGHENLGLGVANTVIAARAGATQIDGSVRRFGAGAGNTPLEAFVGVCDKLGWTTGIDFLHDRRRLRGRHQAGHAGGVPARPDDADDGLRRRLLLVPQARRQRRRPLRRLAAPRSCSRPDAAS